MSHGTTSETEIIPVGGPSVLMGRGHHQDNDNTPSFNPHHHHHLCRERYIPYLQEGHVYIW